MLKRIYVGGGGVSEQKSFNTPGLEETIMFQWTASFKLIYFFRGLQFHPCMNEQSL
jgi:hypothetical protein